MAAWPFSKFDGLLGGPLQGSDAEPSPMVPAWLCTLWYSDTISPQFQAASGEEEQPTKKGWTRKYSHFVVYLFHLQDLLPVVTVDRFTEREGQLELVRPSRLGPVVLNQAILPPRWHLTMSGDISGCLNLGEWVPLASCGQRPGMLLNFCQCTGQSHNKEWSIPKCQ